VAGGFSQGVLVFLTLCIAPVLYEVRRFNLDHALAHSGVRLRKLATGTVYEVAFVGTDPRCSCPDFVLRRKGRGEKCKHILALEQVLLLP
jgi:hypothetical protein